jgi:hypothetical protein
MWPTGKAMLHSVYDQPDAPAVQAQFDRLIDYVTDTLPAARCPLPAARCRASRRSINIVPINTPEIGAYDLSALTA